MTNVLTLKEIEAIEIEVEAELEAETLRAIEAFNLVFARWLVARAAVVAPTEDGNCNDADVDKLDGLTIEVARTRAIHKYQIQWKGEALKHELKDFCISEGADLLIDSILADMRAFG